MAAPIPIGQRRGPNVVIEGNRQFRVTADWLKKVGEPPAARRAAASRKLREAIQRETPVLTGRTRRTMTVRSYLQGGGLLFKVLTAARYAVWIKHKKPRWPQYNLFMQRGYKKSLPELQRLLTPLPLATKPASVSIKERYGGIIGPSSSPTLNKLLRRRQLDYGDAGRMRSIG